MLFDGFNLQELKKKKKLRHFFGLIFLFSGRIFGGKIHWNFDFIFFFIFWTKFSNKKNPPKIELKYVFLTIMLKFLTSLLLFIFTISFSTYTLIFLPFPSQLTLLFIHFFTISFSNLYSTISFLYHNHLFPLQRFTATTFYHLFSPHLFATFFHQKHHHRHHLSLPPSPSTITTSFHHLEG